MNPRTDNYKPTRRKPAKRGTPVRNGLLLVLLAAVLTGLVLLLPKEAGTKKAVILADGGENATVSALENPTLAITEVMSSNKSA